MRKLKESLEARGYRMLLILQQIFALPLLYSLFAAQFEWCYSSRYFLLRLSMACDLAYYNVIVTAAPLELLLLS